MSAPSKKPTATLELADTQIRFRLESYSTTFPVAHLPEWLRFYRRERDRAKTPLARARYQADVAALEAVETKLKQRGKAA